MLLRIRGPDGMVRITVEPSDTFAKLGEQVRMTVDSYGLYMY